MSASGWRCRCKGTCPRPAGCRARKPVNFMRPNPARDTRPRGFARSSPTARCWAGRTGSWASRGARRRRGGHRVAHRRATARASGLRSFSRAPYPGTWPGRRSTPTRRIATAQLAVANALDGAGRRVSDLVIHHCTYTDPESGPGRGAAERGARPRRSLARVGEGRAGDDRWGGGRVRRPVRTRNGVIVGATFVAALADNCLLSLMPSAGRTHKKLKKN